MIAPVKKVIENRHVLSSNVIPIYGQFSVRVKYVRRGYIYIVLKVIPTRFSA